MARSRSFVSFGFSFGFSVSMRALCRHMRGRERLHSWMTRSNELKVKRSESGKQPEFLSKSKSGHRLGLLPDRIVLILHRMY